MKLWGLYAVNKFNAIAPYRYKDGINYRFIYEGFNGSFTDKESVRKGLSNGTFNSSNDAALNFFTHSNWKRHLIIEEQ